jgi:uncharacterized membrane protein
MRRLITALVACNLAVLVISLFGASVAIGLDLFAWRYEMLATALVVENVATCAAVSMLLMSASQGWPRTVVLLTLSFAITAGLEMLSMATGFPSGATYEYTRMAGPTLAAGLPYLVPIAWFMMLYPCMQVAFSLPIRPCSAVAVAGAMMTLWDVALDPTMSNHPGLWVWHHQGGFYGIPLQNFLSWFLTASLAVAVYLRLAGPWRPDTARPPLLLYATQGFFAAALAAMSGRGWATLVWLAGFAVVLAGIYWRGRVSAAVPEPGQALLGVSRAAE